MAKKIDSPQQLLLRVFTKIEGSVAKDVERVAHAPSSLDVQVRSMGASMEDKLVYKAMLDRYFKSEK